MFKFYRNIHLKAYSHNLTVTSLPQPNAERGQSTTPFRAKSTFYPVNNNACINAFTNNVSHEVEQLFRKPLSKVNYNLTKEEKHAIEWIKKNENIIIKQAHKGGATVVWGRNDYIKEALRQLNNSEYYLPLPNNPLSTMDVQLGALVEEAKNKQWISDKEANFLLPKHPRLATFYMSPKVHKNLLNPPGRPIISGNGTISEPASKFIDYFIKPIVQTI